VVCLSVCLSITIVSCTKTAEPIKMPFGLWTQVGPRKHVLDGILVHVGETWRLLLKGPCAAEMWPQWRSEGGGGAQRAVLPEGRHFDDK